MNEPKLKPCPFCGGEAEYKPDYVDTNPDPYYTNCGREREAIHCLKCQMIFIMDDCDNVYTKEDTIELWNRRGER